MEDLIESIVDERNAEAQKNAEPQADPLDDVLGSMQQQPPAAPPEAKPAPQKEDYFKTYFPDYESVDQVKEKITKASELEAETTKLKEELDRVKSSLKGFDAGLDPNYLRLQKIEKENPKLAPVYKRMLLGEIDNKELLKMSLVMDDPDLAEDKEMLDMRLEEKYPVLFDEDADPDSDEYQKAMKKLNYDAKKAEQRLKSEFEKIDVPMAETPEMRKEKVQKILKSWDGFDFKNKELTTVKVSLDGEGENHLMDIEIPEGERTTYLKAAMQYMIDNGLEKSKESVKHIQDYVRGLWIGGNLQKYNRMIAEHSRKMGDREWRSFIHNPKPVKVDVNPGTKSSVDDFISNLEL